MGALNRAATIRGAPSAEHLSVYSARTIGVLRKRRYMASSKTWQLVFDNNTHNVGLRAWA